MFMGMANRIGAAGLGGGAVAPSFILDNLTNVAGAYSFRRLSTTYDGPVVRIRRSSDDTESDFNLVTDGDVVDTDGVSQLIIDIPVGNYYLMISHRNHLGVQTAVTVTLTGLIMSIDLTGDSALVEGGTNGIKDMGDGSFAIFAGDFNGNGQVQNSDVTETLPFIGLPGYENADINMNGQVQNSDILNMINPNIGRGEQSANRSLFAKRSGAKKD